MDPKPNITDRVVDFLFEKDATRLGESPWEGAIGDNETASPLDLGKLFPTGQNADTTWLQQLPRAVIEDIVGGIGQGPPSANDEKPKGWGWDVCAWYQPVHFFGHDWGIFIREDWVVRQARLIGQFLSAPVTHVPDQLVAEALLRASLALYFLHEHYHHKVESLGVRLHVVEQRSRYLPYKANVYRPHFGTDDCLEEALANADSWHRIADQPYARWLNTGAYHAGRVGAGDVLVAARKALEWSFAFSPPGYRMASDYLSDPAFEEGEDRLHGLVQEATLTPGRKSSEWSVAPRLIQSLFPFSKNIWTVVPAGRSSIFPTRSVSPIATASTAVTQRLLESNGYSVVPGGKGSHIKMKDASGKTIVLPCNRDHLSPGVARNVAQVLGLGGLSGLRQAVYRL